MGLKNKKRKSKEKAVLYGKNLNEEDILTYLPDSFKRKLSKREIGYIKDAFYKAVLAYQKQEEENYLNRMLV